MNINEQDAFGNISRWEIFEMTLTDFIEELDIAIKQDGHDIYCDAESAEMIKRYLIEPEKAEWIKPTGMMPPEHHGHYECSSCGTWAGRTWLKPWKGALLTKHCPGCGKEMINYEI